MLSFLSFAGLFLYIFLLFNPPHGNEKEECGYIDATNLEATKILDEGETMQTVA